MAEDRTGPENCPLPTEILLIIFTFLSAKSLTKCREVCSRWKHIVDSLARSDDLWRKFCKRDYMGIYQVARSKARPGLLWHNIYRSLSLWPKLLQAREMRDEFASASEVNNEIRDFRVLRDGIIGVHKRRSIMYYDIDTLEPSSRGAITGDYLHYTENEQAIVILSYHLTLFIIRKSPTKPLYETVASFDDCKTFILVNKDVYYVNLNDEIFMYNFGEPHNNRIFIKRIEDGVMALGHNGNLNVLTFQRDIYTYNNKQDLVYVLSLGPTSNLLHQLQQYNFLERLDWRIYFQWMYILNHSIPEGPLRDIVTVRTYGDIVFVGSNWGVLRIYHAPYASGEFDIFNAEPIKQYNFMERFDCPVLSTCPILQVDVLEGEDGHTVIVAMPKKIAVLNFSHTFKRTASVAMLPYADVQKMKLIKLDQI